MPADTILRVKPPGGVWEAVGVDTAPGRALDGLSCSANEQGPDTLAFTVARDGNVPWRDLLPFGEVELDVPGCGVVWGGRVWDTAYPAPQSVSVGCRGWQYALDDDLLQRVWVHHKMGDWKDARTVPGQNLTYWTQAGGRPRAGEQLQIGWGTGEPYFPYQANGVVLDAGYAGAIKGIYVRATDTGIGTTSAYHLVLRGTDTPYTHFGSGEDAGFWETDYSFSGGGISDAWKSATSSTGKRYAAVFLYMDSGSGTGNRSKDEFLTIHELIVVSDTGYISSNASVLKASDVVKNVRGTSLPLLSADETRVSTSSFSIPHLTTEGGYWTPRQVFTAVNAYHDWLVGVDAERRVVLMARPTTVAAVIGEWSGAAHADAGDSGEELFNRVIVQGTGVTGEPVVVERTATSPVLAAASVTRARVLTVNAPVTTAAAEALGDAWLATRNARPTRGSITIKGPTAARTPDGMPVPPAQFLRLVGQRVQLQHRWDPDTGGLAREGTISAVTYTPATDTAQLTLDSPRDRLDALLGRLAAVRGAGQPLQ